MNRKIIIAIFLSLALVFGIGLIWPKYQELNFLGQRNKEKRVEIQGREERLQDLKKAGEELKNYQAQLSKIDSALPFNPGLEILFNFLQKVSSQSGLILKEIKPSAAQPSSAVEGVKEVELSLTVSGTYSSFKNFLSVLEKNSRLIRLESVSFSSSEGKGPQDFDLKIKIYSY